MSARGFRLLVASMMTFCFMHSGGVARSGDGHWLPAEPMSSWQLYSFISLARTTAHRFPGGGMYLLRVSEVSVTAKGEREDVRLSGKVIQTLVGRPLETFDFYFERPKRSSRDWLPRTQWEATDLRPQAMLLVAPWNGSNSYMPRSVYAVPAEREGQFTSFLNEAMDFLQRTETEQAALAETWIREARDIEKFEWGIEFLIWKAYDHKTSLSLDEARLLLKWIVENSDRPFEIRQRTAGDLIFMLDSSSPEVRKLLLLRCLEVEGSSEKSILTKEMQKEAFRFVRYAVYHPGTMPSPMLSKEEANQLRSLIPKCSRDEGRRFLQTMLNSLAPEGK